MRIDDVATLYGNGNLDLHNFCRATINAVPELPVAQTTLVVLYCAVKLFCTLSGRFE